MIRGKQKTALPATTGKAAIETGIYICNANVPAPIIAQNKAFDQSFLGRC